MGRDKQKDEWNRIQEDNRRREAEMSRQGGQERQQRQGYLDQLVPWIQRALEGDTQGIARTQVPDLLRTLIGDVDPYRSSQIERGAFQFPFEQLGKAQGVTATPGQADMYSALATALAREAGITPAQRLLMERTESERTPRNFQAALAAANANLAGRGYGRATGGTEAAAASEIARFGGEDLSKRLTGIDLASEEQKQQAYLQGLGLENQRRMANAGYLTQANIAGADAQTRANLANAQAQTQGALTGYDANTRRALQQANLDQQGGLANFDFSTRRVLSQAELDQRRALTQFGGQLDANRDFSQTANRRWDTGIDSLMRQAGMFQPAQYENMANQMVGRQQDFFSQRPRGFNWGSLIGPLIQGGLGLMTGGVAPMLGGIAAGATMGREGAPTSYPGRDYPYF